MIQHLADTWPIILIIGKNCNLIQITRAKAYMQLTVLLILFHLGSCLISLDVSCNNLNQNQEVSYSWSVNKSNIKNVSSLLLLFPQHFQLSLDTRVDSPQVRSSKIVWPNIIEIQMLNSVQNVQQIVLNVLNLCNIKTGNSFSIQIILKQVIKPENQIRLLSQVSCPIGYYLQSSNCYQCINGCAQCSKFNSCNRCSPSLFLYQIFCVTDCEGISKQLTGVYGACFLCPEGCDTCLDQNCTSCLEGYVLQQSACLSYSQYNSQFISSYFTSNNLTILPGTLTLILITIVLFILKKTSILNSKLIIKYILLTVNSIIILGELWALVMLNNQYMTQSSNKLSYQLLSIGLGMSYLLNIIFIIYFYCKSKIFLSNTYQDHRLIWTISIIAFLVDFRLFLICYCHMSKRIQVQFNQQSMQIHTICTLGVLFSIIPAIGVINSLDSQSILTNFVLINIDYLVLLTLNIIVTTLNNVIQPQQINAILNSNNKNSLSILPKSKTNKYDSDGSNINLNREQTNNDKTLNHENDTEFHIEHSTAKQKYNQSQQNHQLNKQRSIFSYELNTVVKTQQVFGDKAQSNTFDSLLQIPISKKLKYSTKDIFSISQFKDNDLQNINFIEKSNQKMIQQEIKLNGTNIP